MSPSAGRAAPAPSLTSARTAPTRTLAFVESPVQLLNVLEWAHRHGAGAPDAATPTPPAARTGVPAPGGPPDGPSPDGRPSGGPSPDGRPSDDSPPDRPSPVAAAAQVRVPGAREGGGAGGGAPAQAGSGGVPEETGSGGGRGEADSDAAGACADGPVTVVVLTPTDPMTRGQLRRMSEIARDEGHSVRWEEARGAGATTPLRTVRSLTPLLRAARRVVIGDPFSRYVQVLLTLTRARDLVVVDDGTATMEFVAQLGRGERLVRWHRRGRRPGAREMVLAPVSASARRRLTPGRRRTVEVFSSMPIEDAPDGVRVTVNDFRWTRARFGPPRVATGADLVGTSLVETGVVDPERYLAAVAALAREHGAARYFAHRREDAAKLHRVAAETGLQIVRPDLPLELIARRGPIGRTIVSFPSTVVHTLPLALIGTGVKVAVRDIDPAWLTDRASPRAQGFLAGITGTARDVQRLDAVPAPPPEGPRGTEPGEPERQGRPAPA